MSGDSKNFILALILSGLIIIGWQYFYVKPELERQKARQEAEVSQTAPDQTVPKVAGDTATPSPTAPAGAASAVTPRAQAIATTPRIKVKTPSLTGSISLRGAQIDDLKLIKYRETVEPDSANITLLSPSGTAKGYFAEQGWAAAGGAGTKVPGPKTQWTAPKGAVLTPDTPVTLSWDNGEGLVFHQTISVDKDYMFSVRQSVTNNTGKAVSLFPYARVQRQYKPKTTGIYVLHEGLIGVLDEVLQEIDYGDVEDDPRGVEKTSLGGWLGITDKYFALTLIPDQKTAFKGRFFYRKAGGRDLYQTDYLASQPVTIAAGGEGVFEARVFAGAKVVRIVNGYRDKFNIAGFDLLIDWGWFKFLTKPLFWLLDHIKDLVGNFGVAILIVTVLVKLAFLPLANKSYASMAKMKKLQPEMMKIRERYADDKVKQQQLMMELYKKEKVSPLSGCLPILVQIPVFFALYKVIYVTIDMRHAPFIGWIRDLSAPDPTSLFNLFGLIPVELPQFLMIGVLPLIMGITMWIQMRLNPAPPDPVQAQIFNWMPLIFTVMLARFPSGLVLYWAWNNTLSIFQQYYIMKRNGVEVNLMENIRKSLPFLNAKGAD